MSKEFETSFYAVEVELIAPELAPELSAAPISIKPSDRPFIQEAAVKKDASPEILVPKLPVPETVGASSQRCLTHCWHNDQEWEQGQRCLVACWQSGYAQADISACQLLHKCPNEK